MRLTGLVYTHRCVVKKERIEAIPDGSTSTAKQASGWAPSTSHKGFKFDSTYGILSIVFTLILDYDYNYNYY